MSKGSHPTRTGRQQQATDELQEEMRRQASVPATAPAPAGLHSQDETFVESSNASGSESEQPLGATPLQPQWPEASGHPQHHQSPFERLPTSSSNRPFCCRRTSGGHGSVIGQLLQTDSNNNADRASKTKKEDTGTRRENINVTEWQEVKVEGNVMAEPTTRSVLAFVIYYFLRKHGIRWSQAGLLGSQLLRQANSEFEFDEYELPLRAPTPTGGGSSLSEQFRMAQRPENAANSARRIGYGMAVIERPHGHFNHLVFHVVRVMVEHYDGNFREQHPDIDMIHNTRVDQSRLRPMLRGLIRELIVDGVREGRIIGVLVLVGSLAVQCYEREMFVAIDDLIWEANDLFNELVEPWLIENGHWVQLLVCTVTVCTCTSVSLAHLYPTS